MLETYQCSAGPPDFHINSRVPLRADLTSTMVSSKVKVTVCPNIKGKTRGITPGGFHSM